jgi:hypothetical protein
LTLCERALRGELSYADLTSLWPASSDTSGLLSLIREDLEDGVAHFPGAPFSGKPVWEEWHASEMYRSLLVDAALLRTDRNDDELLGLRKELGDSIADLTLPESKLRERILELTR